MLFCIPFHFTLATYFATFQTLEKTFLVSIPSRFSEWVLFSVLSLNEVNKMYFKLIPPDKFLARFGSFTYLSIYLNCSFYNDQQLTLFRQAIFVFCKVIFYLILVLFRLLLVKWSVFTHFVLWIYGISKQVPDQSQWF